MSGGEVRVVEVPEPTLGSQSGFPRLPPALRLPRPGIPLPLVLGGGAAALMALVVLGAWVLRPAEPVAPGVVVTPPPAVAEVPPSVVPPVATAAVATSGTLRVVSEPVGARVLVDGRSRGRCPLELAELAFGSYEVRVEQPGYEPERRRVTLSAEAASAELRLALKQRAAVTTGAADFVSTPAGAAVSVDGKPAGQTPLRGFKLQPGRRQVELVLDGHETWSSTLEVTAGETGRVEVRLRPRPAPPTPEPVDVSRVYPNEPGQVDTLARKLSGASPSYPSGRAPRLRSGQRVSVLVRFVVDDAGAVSDVVVVESAGTLVDDVVVAAVRGWKFEPATKGGVRVKVEASFRQTFLGA
jgi:TonB family protein